jgi:hypothetical protein
VMGGAAAQRARPTFGAAAVPPIPEASCRTDAPGCAPGFRYFRAASRSFASCVAGASGNVLISRSSVFLAAFLSFSAV